MTKFMKVMQSTSTDLMPPPVGGVQVETAVPGKMGKARGKKGKAKAQGGNDEDSDNQTIDNDDPSYKDKYGLSAQCIVQQASNHSALPEIHSTDLRFY